MSEVSSECPSVLINEPYRIVRKIINGQYDEFTIAWTSSDALLEYSNSDHSESNQDNDNDQDNDQDIDQNSNYDELDNIKIKIDGNISNDDQYENIPELENLYYISCLKIIKEILLYEYDKNEHFSYDYNKETATYDIKYIKVENIKKIESNTPETNYVNNQMNNKLGHKIFKKYIKKIKHLSYNPMLTTNIILENLDIKYSNNIVLVFDKWSDLKQLYEKNVLHNFTLFTRTDMYITWKDIEETIKSKYNKSTGIKIKWEFSYLIENKYLLKDLIGMINFAIKYPRTWVNDIKYYLSENLPLLYIESLIDYKFLDWKGVSNNKNINDKFVTKYIKNIDFVNASMNKSISSGLIYKYKNKDWDWKKIISHRNFSKYYLIDNKFKNMIKNDRYINLDIVIKNSQLKWDYDYIVLKNVNITTKYFKYPCFQIYNNYIKNKKFNVGDLYEYPKLLDLCYFESERSLEIVALYFNTTKKIYNKKGELYRVLKTDINKLSKLINARLLLLNYPELKIDFTNLSANYSLKLKYVKDNPELPWSVHHLCKNPALKLKEIMELKEIFNTDLPWDSICLYPNITYKFVKENEEYLNPNILFQNKLYKHPYYRSEEYKQKLVKIFLKQCGEEILKVKERL
jgi:hypothetical protein